MISLYYPILPESSGASAHRRGLLQGFHECGMPCIVRNQFSRWDSLCFVLDALRGRTLYIRMNGNSQNVQLVLGLLHRLGKHYIIEINAPHQEDQSEVAFYIRTIRMAKLVVCVSAALKQYLTQYNGNVLVVSNGGVMTSVKNCDEAVSSSYFLFIYNAHWHWQSADNVERVARVLEQHNLNLKVVDVAGSLKTKSIHPNIEIVEALSHKEYLSELQEAVGFYLEYYPVQDAELGFYSDSLKFRDYWNTNKPILVVGPRMKWTPNPQTPEYGIFTIEEFAMLEEHRFEQLFGRQPYEWKHACSRILGLKKFGRAAS